MYAQTETHTADPKPSNGTKADCGPRCLWRDARESAAEAGHENGRHEQEFSVPALEPTEGCIDEDSTECGG